jgi:hypothetical protein
MLANCATREPLVRWSLGSKNERKAVVFAIAARNGSTKRRRVRNGERTRFRANRSMSRSSMTRFARRVAHPEHSTEGRNSPQIARREPARFRDRPVPVAHKRPDRTCPGQFMLLGLPVHATRARFQRQGSHTVRYRQPRLRTLR